MKYIHNFFYILVALVTSGSIVGFALGATATSTKTEQVNCSSLVTKYNQLASKYNKLLDSYEDLQNSLSSAQVAVAMLLNGKSTTTAMSYYTNAQPGKITISPTIKFNVSFKDPQLFTVFKSGNEEKISWITTVTENASSTYKYPVDLYLKYACLAQNCPKVSDLPIAKSVNFYKTGEIKWVPPKGIADWPYVYIYAVKSGNIGTTTKEVASSTLFSIIY